MRTSLMTRAAAVGTAAGALALSLLAAPAAQAADGTTSLASVLKAGQAKFDKDFADYDILTKAVEAVLAAKPNSPVKVLADGNTAVTAFIPNDQAFINLASALTGKKVSTENAAFKAVAGLGIPTVEQVLQYHVVPGPAILSEAALKANGAKLKTALDGKTVGVRVNTSAPSITLVDRATKLPNPKVILTQVDINKGNKQVAHGIDAVLLPMNP
jgi:uncharacterized surface protein with fasciclin (FAS1) repeats